MWSTGIKLWLYGVIISQTTQCSVLEMTRSVTYEETSNAFMKDMDLKSYSWLEQCYTLTCSDMTDDFAVRQLFPTRFPQNIVRGSTWSRGIETNFEKRRIIPNAPLQISRLFFPGNWQYWSNLRGLIYFYLKIKMTYKTGKVLKFVLAM